MIILKKIAARIDCPVIGACVEIEEPRRLFLGRGYWHADFSFESNGREYWGTIDASGDCNIMTRGSNGYGRLLAESHKLAWRAALADMGVPLIRAARNEWRAAQLSATSN